MKYNLNLMACLTAAILFSCTKGDLPAGYETPAGQTITAYSQSSGSVSVSGNTYTSSSSDVNAVKVSGGSFTMENCTVLKSGGDTSDSDGSSFYGINSAILSTGDGVVTMSGGSITTNAKGANGVVAYQGTVNISDVTIDCSKSVSRGIHATGGGVINAINLTITTASETSSLIATDRGGGTVTVDGGTYTAKGKKSAVCYSTGEITVRHRERNLDSYGRFPCGQRYH